MIAQVIGVTPMTSNRNQSFWLVKLNTGHECSVWDANLMNVIKVGAQLDFGFKQSQSQTTGKTYLNIISAVQPGQQTFVPPVQPAQLPQTTQLPQNTGAIPPENLPNPPAPTTPIGGTIEFPPPVEKEQMNLDQARRTSISALNNAAEFVASVKDMLWTQDPPDLGALEATIDHFHGKFIDMIMKRISTLTGDFSVGD